MDLRTWLDDAGYLLALGATACTVVLMIIAGAP
jgi:hypothetical protein